MKGFFSRTRATVCLIAMACGGASAAPRTAVAQPPEHSQVGEEARGVIAGAVMVALTERLHDTALRIRLKTVGVKSREGSAQNLEGIGEYMSPSHKDWTVFRFNTRYVPNDGSATYPALDFGPQAGAPQRVLNDPALVGELETRVCDQIAKDNGVRDVRLQFDEIQSRRSPGGALDISADARVDVGVDTARKTRIEGSYDERARRWINVNYLFDIPDRLTGGR
ncbi:hypothetical protein [Solilutibacter silvestris]|uniref:Uncharacterized protein n=1 Tax=Solilutibacter silvestris TaxID=1645665 RepID=A0A2K1PZD1_9GAMM|nr:hypothetical protein [Lysobacter silvestris]PNS08129.1 hypothetical protein Lysil_2305 [Lysobacter silvestris]